MAQPKRIVNSRLGNGARHHTAVFAGVHGILVERVRIKRRDGDTRRCESAAKFVARPAMNAASYQVMRILRLRERLTLPNYFFKIRYQIFKGK